jgi:hypothetical protein
MAETKKLGRMWSWLTGLVLAIAAFLIWYYPYDMSTECTGPVARCQAGEIVPAGPVDKEEKRSALPWQALAGAEIMACLSGISFAWFVVRLLGARKGEEQEGTKKEAGGAGTPDDDSKAKKPSQLFATRAARVEKQLSLVKEKSRTQRAAILAIQAARVQAAEEAALARAARMQAARAARDLAQQAETIAPGVIDALRSPAPPTSTRKKRAMESAQQQCAEQGMQWTDAHTAQLNEILAFPRLISLDPKPEYFVQAAIAKAETSARGMDDSEAAANTLADAISRALGGNAG